MAQPYKNPATAPGDPHHSPIFPKMPPIPPPEMGDSIKAKVLGRGGVGLGGEEEAFLQKGSSSPPNLLLPPFSYPALPLQLQTLCHTLRQGTVQRKKGPPPAGRIKHVPAAVDGAENVAGNAFGRGYDAGGKTPPGNHPRGNVPRLDRQNVDAGTPKPRPQAGKERREPRLR